MIRKAYKMQIFKDCEAEYERRHRELWPEMRTLLKSKGVINYFIYLDKTTLTLFSYVEIDSIEEWNSIAKTEVCQKWWHYMKDIMATNSDESPISSELEEVFAL